MDDLIGKVVGGYEVLRLLGEGGMAKVYLAMQQSMNRQVALKVLPRQYVNDDTYYQRFEREVRIVSQLEHRNIVPVYDYGKHEGQPFIAMRYMPTGSVDDLLRDGALSMDKILNIVAQIAPALDYAHTKEVLHRDLKPANVLMDDGGGAYLTDFGIARLTDGQNAVITTQGVVGTPSYMSPEQAQGKQLDGRSDVYALGVMLFEMATGRRPFENDTPYSIAVMQVTTPPLLPRSYNTRLSTAVETVILKSLRKQPEERYQTASDLHLALRIAIENPVSAFDTEPNFKKPNIAPSPSLQSPMSSTQSPPPIQPITPQPQPLQYANYPVPQSSGSRVIPAYETGLRSRIRQQRKANPAVGVVMGGAIGCGLLSIIVIVALVGLNAAGLLGLNATPAGGTAENVVLPSATPPDDQTDTADTETPATPNSTPLGTLNPTAEAARATLLARTTQQVTTPIPTPNTSAGTGGSITSGLPDALQSATGSIVYAGMRETDNGTSFEIVRLDLATRVETLLTSSPGDDSYPVVSPDGNWIAFQSERDGDFDIYIMPASGGAAVKLTSNNYVDRLPGWSPDSAWLVYSADVRSDENYDIYRIPRAGGTAEAIYSSTERKSHPRYSPDGRYIVFTSGAANDASTWEILRFDTTTGDIANLTNNNRRDASSVFSPDGQTILYITMLADGSGNAIATMDVNGANGQIVFNTPASEWAASYSPDGRFIVFASNMTNEDQVYLMTAQGTDAVQLSPDRGGAPVWLNQ
jgi:serine/threonine protein kinase/Tol biopolymer transport system component